jgi:hypothetical protein
MHPQYEFIDQMTLIESIEILQNSKFKNQSTLFRREKLKKNQIQPTRKELI